MNIERRPLPCKGEIVSSTSLEVDKGHDRSKGQVGWGSYEPELKRYVKSRPIEVAQTKNFSQSIQKQNSFQPKEIHSIWKPCN